MLQLESVLGEVLEVGLEIDTESLKSLEMLSVPKGMLSYDERTGLATVIMRANAKPTKIKIGRLLKRVGESETKVLEIATKAASIVAAYKAELKFTNTSEEAVHIYEVGPQSCMKGQDCVGVYASKEVKVAYIELDGDIIARSVVCISEEIGKHFVRSYGFKEPLEHKLRAKGFVQGSLEGCRVLKLEDSDGNIMMPFLDGETGCDLEDDYVLICSGGEFEADRTDGTLTSSYCDSCGGTTHIDELTYSEYLEEYLCESCFEHSHVYVGSTWYHEESDEITRTYNDEWELTTDVVYIDYRDEYALGNECSYNYYTEEYILNSDI